MRILAGLLSGVLLATLVPLAGAGGTTSGLDPQRRGPPLRRNHQTGERADLHRPVRRPQRDRGSPARDPPDRGDHRSLGRPERLDRPGGATIPASEITVRREYLHPNVLLFDDAEMEPAPGGGTKYYDALVENTPRSLAANVTQPYHYSVHVPTGQAPGVYTGTATVQSSAGNVAVPVRLTVYSTTLPPTNQSTFKLNNWTTSAGWDYAGTVKAIPLQYGVTMYDANWWKVIENMARNHAKHRNNVVFADFQALLIPDTTIDAAGNYTFGWNTFDRFLQIYADAGALQWIHTPHLLIGGTTPKLEMLKRGADGKTQMVPVLTNTAESNAYLDKVFPALKQHLDAKGWTDKFYMSANDESTRPAETTAANWLYAKYRQSFPNPKLNEAELAIVNPAATVTSNTPILNLYEDNVGHFQSKRLGGNELWLYNCIGPRGPYLNRFIGSHLDKTRLTPLLAWKTNSVGYLHWGWNYWFRNVGEPFDRFDTFDGPQTGDNFLVRPNRAAYDLYDSIRSETQLDGAEDYELFTQLAATKPVLAKALANSLITNSYTFDHSGTAVDNVHRQVLDALAAGGPDQTYPYSDDFTAGANSWQASKGTLVRITAGCSARPTRPAGTSSTASRLARTPMWWRASTCGSPVSTATTATRTGPGWCCGTSTAPTSTAAISWPSATTARSSSIAAARHSARRWHPATRPGSSTGCAWLRAATQSPSMRARGKHLY